MSKICHIYTLEDSNTNEIFYVGKSTNVRMRLFIHVSWAKRGTTTPIYAHIRKICRRPILKVIDKIECESIHDRQTSVLEASWINKLREDGHKLVNVRCPNFETDMHAISNEDFEILERNCYLLNFLISTHDIDITYGRLLSVIRLRRSVHTRTLEAINKIIEILKTNDYSNFSMRHRVPVIAVTDSEVNEFKKKHVGAIVHIDKNTGIGERELRRIFSGKTISLRTYLKFTNSLNS